MSLNVVTLFGNLTRDPEAETLANGTALTKFSIAVNEKFSVNGELRERVSYFDVTVWGKQAETVAKYLEKGRAVNVTGRLQQDRWEKDGQKRSKVYIVASDVQFLAKGGGGNGDGAQRSSDSSYGGGQSSSGGGSYGSGGLQPISTSADDDDIPF